MIKKKKESETHFNRGQNKDMTVLLIDTRVNQ